MAAVAYQIHLAYPHLRLCIVDKENGVAQHQTGHNSGVLHSGIYYPPGSQKAQNCLKGKVLMEDFAKKEGFPMNLVEKSSSPKNRRNWIDFSFYLNEQVSMAFPRKMISREELLEREPHVNGLKAILVEKAGIVQYSRVCERLLEILLESKQHTFIPNFKVSHSEKTDQGIRIFADKQGVEGKWVINAAGLYSDKLMKSSGQTPNYKIIPLSR